VGVITTHRVANSFQSSLRSSSSSSSSSSFSFSSSFYSFVQPWDPVVRLFTSEDPTYPLVGDLGEDGVTLYANGPQRVLRPLVRSVLLIAPTWPSLRDIYLESGKHKHQSVGKQYVLLPPVAQYLSDRFAAVNVNVPEVDSIMLISSDELLPCMYETFPLDEFSISFVPAALRSFIHHFHPAYTMPLVSYTGYPGREMEGGDLVLEGEGEEEGVGWV
jgi:hypothetical protein